MSLASGASVKIGTYEYQLDRSKPDPYKHTFESLFSQTTAIAGEIAKQQLRPEKMLWYMTDWSGGEGYRIYYPQAPTRYDISNSMNITNRGLLTTRPRRYRSSIARLGTELTWQRPAGGSAWNKAIIMWEDTCLYSTSASSWSTVGINGTLVLTAYRWFGANTDGRYIAMGILSEGTGDADRIVSIDASVAAPTGADIFSGTTVVNPPCVLEILEGTVYAWSGDATGILELTKGAGMATASAFATVVYSSGIVPTGTWGTDYWTDIEAAEAALYMSMGTPAGSVIFESRQDIGRPFWTSPAGFTIKKLIYHMGVLFALGSQNAAGRKYGAVWAIPLSTRSPIFISAPRRHRNEELYEFSVGCPGYGSTVFFGDENSGKIFLYDIENDALSLWDDLINGGTGDGTTFNGNELLSIQTAAIDGAATAAQAGWIVETGIWATSTTSPYAGTHQLSQTGATATGIVATAAGTAGIFVLPSTSYTAFGYVRIQSGTSTDTHSMGIRWYDASGALLSTSTGSTITTTTTYTQFFVTATSPATAAFAALVITKTGTDSDDQFFDNMSLHTGSSTATRDRLAFLAMHGSRLFGATYQPAGGVATSLQVISWDDGLKENRDASQAISGTWESSEWDFGVPQEIKALNGVYVNWEITDTSTTSGLVANSRITISYALDSNIFLNTYTDLTTITSATTVAAKGRHFITVSDGSSTIKFNRIKFKVTLDNNSSTTVAPPILYSVVPEVQLMAYSEVWDLILRIQDEADNERPRARQWKAHQLRDNLEDLAQNKAYVTLLDGARYGSKVSEWTSHVVQVEDPQDVIEDLDTGEGYCRVRLRAVPV